MKARWGSCLRPGCLRSRRRGFPLCFEDWDALPPATREAWRAAGARAWPERRLAEERWQISFLEQEARGAALGAIEIAAWAPQPKRKRRRSAA